MIVDPNVTQYELARLMVREQGVVGLIMGWIFLYFFLLVSGGDGYFFK